MKLKMATLFGLIGVSIIAFMELVSLISLRFFFGNQEIFGFIKLIGYGCLIIFFVFFYQKQK